jgi:uncharacterized protein (UPF0264 family)
MVICEVGKYRKMDIYPAPLTPRHSPPQLLVSVRSAEEARAALDGGAALIDVKEPSRGSLGRADARVIREIISAVGGRRPVSAALGEWAEEAEIAVKTLFRIRSFGAARIGDSPKKGPDAFFLTFVKWGLAGCRGSPNWRRDLARLLEKQARPQPVLVAYADWECAKAPSVEEVFALAQENPGTVMLLDTYCKDANHVSGKKRPTLLDWLLEASIIDLCARCRESGVRIALAGSLGVPEIHQLHAARPNWFAVRGAVCEEGNRQGAVQTEKVRQLVEMLDASIPTSLHAG